MKQRGDIARRLAQLLLLMLILWGPSALAQSDEASRAEVEEAVDELPLGGLQQCAEAGDLPLDVRALIRSLVSGGRIGEGLSEGLERLKKRALQAMQEALPSLLSLTAPALLWALSRRMVGKGLSASADMVCFLAEARVLTSLFSKGMAAARLVTGRLSDLIGQFHPLAAFVLSACGRPHAASLMRPAGALALSLAEGVLMQSVFALSAAMAGLTVIGHLSEQLKLEGFFRLCKRVALGLLGGATTLFLGVMKADALLETGRDGLTMRAAEYAVDKLLPVIGGDVADTLGTLVSGTALMRSAVGVTGTAVLVGLCLEPILTLAADILACRLAAALSETMACGSMTRCLNGFADALQILLLAQTVCAALFLILVGAMLRGV